MQIFTAALGTETNTFSPIPTGWAAFTDDLWHRREGSLHTDHWFAGPLKIWRSAAAERGFSLTESVAAFAQPAGRTRQTVWEEMRDMVIGDLAEAPVPDIVLLQLHGAMVSDEEDDCEGDLIERVRAQVGPNVVIGVELDLHAHLTDRMIKAADIVLSYKEYPHVDVNDRAVELFDLCVETAQKRLKPVIAVADCRMLGVWRTPSQPTRGFVEQMHAAEGRNGILSVSFVHGFPWADVPEVGAKIIVVADGDRAAAQALAQGMADRVWAMRTENADPLLSVEVASALALRPEDGLTVFADVSDNAGAGAAGVYAYVWPTSLDSSAVGFDQNQGIVALAVTFHPDFDDAAQGGKNRSVWHPHWVVLAKDKACGAELKVVDIPAGAKPKVPETWPGVPLLIDSPAYPTELDGDAVTVEIPLKLISGIADARFDGVTAGLKVNGNLHAPLLCVSDVFKIASGDLSLPGKVVPAK